MTKILQTAFWCDRCSHTLRVDKKPDGWSEIYFKAGEMDRLVGNDVTYASSLSRDPGHLCASCTSEIVAWFKEGRK